jgi:arylsulfatase A-like enzyme
LSAPVTRQIPGYNSVIGVDNATIGRILLDNGYNTSWFGKDHNTPAFQASQSGPFNQWPTGMGFEYFYGFVGGDSNQWQPNLFRNTTQIYPFQGKPGWNLITGMADEAIDWMTRMALPNPFVIGRQRHLLEKRFKIEAKVTRHAKYVTFQLAEVAITRNLFAAIRDRIARLAIPPQIFVGRMPS